MGGLFCFQGLFVCFMVVFVSLFLTKKLLTLQHFSAADQKSSCLEQHLSSSPLHIVPFKKKSKFVRKTLMEKEAFFPSKGNRLRKTMSSKWLCESVCVTSRNKFNSIPRKFSLLHATLSSTNTHFLPLPPSLLFCIMQKQHAASEKYKPASQ